MLDRKQRFRYYTIILWTIAMMPVLVFAIILIVAATGKLGYMPKIEDLENPKINLASHLISADGKVLGSIYYKNQNRTYVQYDQLPDHLVNALIATEDIRFKSHSGVDFRGLARAFIFRGLLGRESAGGGSTITQQFAKLLFHGQAGSNSERLQQKVKEWIIAVKLERAYTKEEIIALYFNQYDFLYNAVGIESAAQVYFNTTPDSLRIEQSAVLVGMAKNPLIYNPKLYPERSEQRRNTVLDQMKKYNFISGKECDSLKAIPLQLDFQQISHNVGSATYFREYLRKILTAKKPVRNRYSDYSRYRADSAKWENDPLYGWCNKNFKPDGEPYYLDRDGLKIYTTINSRMQIYAENAVLKHLSENLQPKFNKEKQGRSYAPYDRSISKSDKEEIIWSEILSSERGRRLTERGLSRDSIYRIFSDTVDMRVFTYVDAKDDKARIKYVETRMTPLDSILYYKHFLHAGFMAMDPNSGHVKAYVGGINFTDFKYDHVTQGKRQAGSTFKPFLYIVAMQVGYSPCQKVIVAPNTFPVGDSIWSPRTTARQEDIGTEKTLKWGLAMSENYVSSWLLAHFKPASIAAIAYKMGIKSHIDPVPSMIYGPSDMSVEEMVASYTTFVNRGFHIDPLYVTHIEDKFGNELARFVPQETESISEITAAKMISLMQGVVNFGTASRLRRDFGFTAQIAGKTGTTNNNADGWFIGITPNLVAGGWVGGDDPRIHFDYTRDGSGTSTVLPIWGEFMKQVYDDPSLGITQEDEFMIPPGFDPAFLECEDDAQLSSEDRDPIDRMPDYLIY